MENNAPDVLPEDASSFLRVGFFPYFQRPYYQHLAVTTFLQNLGINYASLYKYVPSGYLTQPILTM